MNLLLCYRILGVMPGAEPDAVKRAYRRLTRQWHPDRFGRAPKMRRLAEENFKQINQAYAAVIGLPAGTRRRLKRAVDTALARKGIPPPAAPFPDRPDRKRSPRPVAGKMFAAMAIQALGCVLTACRNRWRRDTRPEPAASLDRPEPPLPVRPRTDRHFDDILQEATRRIHDTPGGAGTGNRQTALSVKRPRTHPPIRVKTRRSRDADRIPPVGRVRPSGGIRAIGNDDET